MPIEHERQGNALFRDDQIRRVPSRDDDRDLLCPAGSGLGSDLSTSSEEEEIEKDTEHKTPAQGRDPIPGPGHGSFLRPSRRLLVTTETEEAAMAAEAIMGESIRPKIG